MVIPAVLVGAGLAQGAWCQVITEVPVPTVGSNPAGIAAGPDGSLWFTEQLGNQIGRITTGGTITEFSIPTTGSNTVGIAAGPDGSLWFTEQLGNQIGRITTGGVITEFPIPTTGSNPVGMAAGPDGNMWFTESQSIGRITTTGTISEFPISAPGGNPIDITVGPDGALWFTEGGPNQIGRITTAGVITEFPVPTAASLPYGIVAGPDGNLWFTEVLGNKIGRVTPMGSITEFPIPTLSSFPVDLAVGADGNIWFTERDANQIGRITPAGVVTEFPVPTAGSKPFGITAGPDGNLWFSEVLSNQIGRITTAPSVPKALVIDAAGNGVFEAGENVPVAPTWENTLTSPADLDGTASGLTGPAGPTYSITDAAADYGTVPAESTANCDDTGNCYTMSITGARPVPHWDASFTETLSGPIAKNWTLHIGGTFPDVPTSHQFYSFIETLIHSGVTGGCGLGNYCPGNSVTRAQMAVFLMKGKFGPDQLYPSATGSVFNDVNMGTFGASFIEALAGFRITGGCGSSNYCPDGFVTRGQMAAFLLKAKHGSAFVPPNCTGIFDDVPCPAHPFVSWIEELADEGITGGCGGANYCPDNPITRGQMAVFLTKTFGLALH